MLGKLVRTMWAKRTTEAVSGCSDDRENGQRGKQREDPLLVTIGSSTENSTSV